jgi:hypothetical protein
MTGDQWLVLPAGGEPGQDQAPEGGQATATAPERHVHTLQFLPAMLTTPSLPVWQHQSLFCGTCHPGYHEFSGSRDASQAPAGMQAALAHNLSIWLDSS